MQRTTSKNYSLDHLTDEALLRDLSDLVARDRVGTAALLAHIGEVDARGLYVAAGYPSMHAYCVEDLRLSEDSAYKRIRAARAARQFPAMFHAVADGRLHLAAVCLLAPHLTAVNSDELIEAATHRRRFEIEQILARRFGAPESPPTIRPLPPGIARPQSLRQLAPGPVAAARGPLPQLALEEAGVGELKGSSDRDGSDRERSNRDGSDRDGSDRAGAPEPDSPPAIPSDHRAQLAPGRVAGATNGADSGDPSMDELAPGRVGSPDLTNTAALLERYSLRVTIDHRTHQKLRYAQALLSHAVAGGDIAQVLDRALEALILQLERQKFGATTRPRRARPSARRRYVPAHVRRAVWERDKGQCTFTGPSGKRCQARRYLEFDHVHPVAQGGRGTVDNMRLRCRAHNQYEADRLTQASDEGSKTKAGNEAERSPSEGAFPGALSPDSGRQLAPPGSEKPRQLAPPGP